MRAVQGADERLSFAGNASSLFTVLVIELHTLNILPHVFYLVAA
jgi:hypothetical protein